MQIIEKHITEVLPYENNPRNNENAVDYVMESIKQFGFKVPIIISKENVIGAGHTRYKAAKKLKLDKVPCIIADDLTEEQIKAFRLADNKVSEYATWDIDLLNEELEGILNIDMCNYGFEMMINEDEEEEEEAEIEFTESLEEEHNYIVLYFDNNIDWLQAKTLFDIKQVKEYSTRKDGSIKKDKKGIGRVINGAKALNKLTEGYFNENKH